jgi:hypothetical protein
VVDLGAVLGAPSELRGERFVTLRTGNRQVALLVTAVLGIRDLDTLTATQELPSLLQGASQNAIETIGTLEERLLEVLQEGRKLPEEIWQAQISREKRGLFSILGIIQVIGDEERSQMEERFVSVNASGQYDTSHVFLSEAIWSDRRREPL